MGSDFRHAINDRFKAAGIEIPYPQRVITVKYQKPEEEKKDQIPTL